MPSKGVILVGGPSVGTRFRPLSMDCPKPLFPIAGAPMIYHHVAALASLPSLKEILLVGFFENSVFDRFLTEVQMEFYNISIRYLREYQSLGTGGGLYHFRDQIRRGNPDRIFVMNADICSSFPLQQMLDFYDTAPNAVATVLGIRLHRSTVRKYGCLVVHPATHEVRHFVEKPETFISDLISCGVYLFSKDIFEIIRDAIIRQRALAQEAGEVANDPNSLSLFSTSPRISLSASTSSLSALASKSLDGRIRLEQDVLAPLAGSGKLFAYVGATDHDFWMQIKTGSSAIPANRMYLHHYKSLLPQRLSTAARQSPTTHININAAPPLPEPEIIQPVFIHPTAIIHPSAKIGPNVSVGPRVLIGRGVRIRDAILLDSVDVRNDAAVLHSIVGWECKIGAWARVEGQPPSATSSSSSAPDHDNSATAKGTKIPSATILGKDVSVADELIIRNCIVLPHKELKASYHNEILM
ncbi:hypothetical protein SeMB42_g00258 [Synchytrium endobioticum]|uniref:mannose-1-phosphate guanylyltransferase n=1 Tax=Synchytrium endobioticum TaxID=286115 RepID=A0A507CM40_9FUNG|nr:hypothetical protein SeLEV6574_g07188 [Synchytrium endobioticum]TPX54431.1 hypothetical protein SeMB42_g00258 [Synchytrium endobioticum]